MANAEPNGDIILLYPCFIFPLIIYYLKEKYLVINVLQKKYAYITGICSSTKRSILTKQQHLLCNTNDKTCLILKIPPLMKPCNQEWMEFSWLITVCCFKERASLKICRLYNMPMRACIWPLLSILKLPAGGGGGGG